jgi:hypothetical protein
MFNFKRAQVRAVLLYFLSGIFWGLK